MGNVFSYFEAIYCINLQSEPEKWHSIQKQFEILSIQNRVQRFEGIPDVVRSRGCSLTHLKLIEEAKASGMRNVLIFEDDTIFVNWEERVLTDAIRNLPPNWELLNIGYNLIAEYSAINFQWISDNLIKIKKGSDVRSNNAYAVNHSAYDTIIERYGQFYKQWKNHPVNWNLDQWYAKNFDRYCVVPLLSVQNQGKKSEYFVKNFNNIFKDQTNSRVRVSREVAPKNRTTL